MTRAFITWQPVLTDHQAFTFQALAHQSGKPVLAYVAVMEDAQRKAQGWADTQVNSVERRLIPRRGFLRYCYRKLREHRADVHFFCSPFHDRRLITCMLMAAWLGVEFYLISEPYSPRAEGYLSDTPKLSGTFKALLRPLLYWGYVHLLRRSASGVFTISKLAFAQYKKAGMPAEKLFPFGYFIPYAMHDVPEISLHSGLRIIFVGSLIQRKGVDILQQAVRQLAARGGKISLDIYGPGAAPAPDHNAIRYCGTIPFGQAQQVIAQYDLLVLPSRYDGWGVVVNEALCAGVPVVCSDHAGAGAVAAALGAGLSFPSGNVNALADVLARLMENPSLLYAMRDAAPAAAQALQPEIAARYMLDVISAPADNKAAIASPWYPESIPSRPYLRLHLTNVAGAGATQLLLSLLPALERNGTAKIAEIYLPDRGALAHYQKSPHSGVAKNYQRRLPNALSRFLECLIFARRNFSGDVPLLVLGDLPLRCATPQTVFVQTSHLLKPQRFCWGFDALKFAISRQVFRLNARYADAFIVQTPIMRAALAASYPAIASKIHIIAQPVPSWLLGVAPRRNNLVASGRGLQLIYPAAGYSHKNHKLLANVDSKSDWPVESLQLTLPPEKNPAPGVAWIRCVGFLSPAEMVEAYQAADALLFLSTDESYGFPLVEAMYMGLPIVCPDLAYARALCLDGAIYFDPSRIDSLHSALETLHSRLLAGWQPDWSKQLSAIPKDWDVVAAGMIEVATTPTMNYV